VSSDYDNIELTKCLSLPSAKTQNLPYLNLWPGAATAIHVLQNILFCVQQKKELHPGLEQRE